MSDDMAIKPQPLKAKLTEWITRLMVRFGRVKRVAVDLTEINQVANQPLPYRMDLETPAGEGELIILGVTLSIDTCSQTREQECIHAEFLCNFSVRVKQSIIYNTHLMLILEAQPNYCEQRKSIGIKAPKVAQLELISDQYSIIKDTSSLLASLIPKPLKPLIDVTIFSTKAILSSKTANKASRYLSLYTSGSKQKVIDYHRPDIEQKIIELTRDNALSYELDQSVFEEKLFADFGKQIFIDQGQLFFSFE